MQWCVVGLAACSLSEFGECSQTPVEPQLRDATQGLPHRCVVAVCRCGALEAANVELKRENASLAAAQQKNKMHKA